MFANFRQLILSLVVVAIAAGVGLVVVGIIHLAPIADQPSTAPASGATAGRSGEPGSSPRGTAEPTPGSSRGGETAILVGAGDIADCDRSEDEITADLIEGIAGTVFTLGDNAYPDGTRRDFEECYAPTWGRPDIKERTRPAAGDEDYDSNGAAAFYEYFGEAAGHPSEGYYAYDAGTWRVYVLNSNCANVGGCGEDSPQLTWLQRDISANPRDCVLAMWHHPYFSSGPSGGGDATVRNFWRVLAEAGAEVVLSGHDHVYERFSAQTAEGESDPKGLVQFVVGTGGADPDRFHTLGLNSVIRERGIFGVLVLRLQPGAYTWEFITIAGREFSDTGSAQCH